MSPRRRRPPVDFGHCQRCGARIHWPPKHTREHSGAQDPGQVVYLDLDGEPKTMAYEPRWGYAVHGAEVADLSANEQREADAARMGDPRDGVRRIVKCYRLHACDPRAVTTHQSGKDAAPLGAADRAAGEHLT